MWNVRTGVLWWECCSARLSTRSCTPPSPTLPLPHTPSHLSTAVWLAVINQQKAEDRIAMNAPMHLPEIEARRTRIEKVRENKFVYLWCLTPVRLSPKLLIFFPFSGILELHYYNIVYTYSEVDLTRFFSKSARLFFRWEAVLVP